MPTLYLHLLVLMVILSLALSGSVSSEAGFPLWGERHLADGTGWVRDFDSLTDALVLDPQTSSYLLPCLMPPIAQVFWGPPGDHVPFLRNIFL